MNNQHAKILDILKETGNRGMNSFEWRKNFIQLPVRIKELKQQGHLITSRRRKNRSVDYVLLEAPPALKAITRSYTPAWEEDTVRVWNEKRGLYTWEVRKDPEQLEY